MWVRFCFLKSAIKSIPVLCFLDFKLCVFSFFLWTLYWLPTKWHSPALCTCPVSQCLTNLLFSWIWGTQGITSATFVKTMTLLCFTFHYIFCGVPCSSSVCFLFSNFLYISSLSKMIRYALKVPGLCIVWQGGYPGTCYAMPKTNMTTWLPMKCTWAVEVPQS